MHEAYIGTLRQLHRQFLNLIKLPDEKLFEIPKGYNNHIFWNFAHSLVTQESLIYSLSGKTSYFDKDTIDAYKNGSKPDEVVRLDVLKEMKEASVKIVDKLENDLKSNTFGGFKPYHLKLFDYPLNNLEDALMFNQIHISLHLGYSLALKRALV